MALLIAWTCVGVPIGEGLGRVIAGIIRHDGDAGHSLFSKTRYAALALQIICPSGAEHVFLLFQKTDEGYNGLEIDRPKVLCSTFRACMSRLEQQGLEEKFDAVYAGIQRAFTEKMVRLENAIRLLEHGMQIGEVYLGKLMFVMGLDMLFMAGNMQKFRERLGGFLGSGSYVFPPVFPPGSVSSQQPNTKVCEVLEDLYNFRNIIVHGREIPEHPFRRKVGLLSTGGSLITNQVYYRAELLLESGLYMLTTALRRIFIEDLIDEVKDSARWKEMMKRYEHRFKESG